MHKVFGTWHLMTPTWPLTSAKNNRLLSLNMTNLHTKYGEYPSFLLGDITSTMLSVLDLWWPQMTFDLYNKPIGSFLPIWWTYIPDTRYLEISGTQGFQNLTSQDPRWPLTSTKNIKLLPINITNVYTKYEDYPSFLLGDIECATTNVTAHTHLQYKSTHTHTIMTA